MPLPKGGIDAPVGFISFTELFVSNHICVQCSGYFIKLFFMFNSLCASLLYFAREIFCIEFRRFHICFENPQR